MDSAGSSCIERTSSEESEIANIVEAAAAAEDKQRSRFASNREFEFARAYPRTIEVDDSDYDDDDDVLESSLESNRMTQIKNPFAFPPSKEQQERQQQQPHPRSPPSTPPPAMAALAQQAAQSVNASVELLRRLQSVDEPQAPTALNDQAHQPQEELVQAALGEVRRTKEQVLHQVPRRHWHRVLPQQEARPLREFPLLFGRCFNLSLNLNILRDAQGMDPTLASRILSDLSILEASLEDRLNRKFGDGRGDLQATEVVGKMMTGLKLATPRPRFGFK